MTTFYQSFSIFFILFVGISGESYNPYQRDVLSLFLQEPNSGLYTKNDAASVEENWLTQKVNHFDTNDNRTWQMRYLRNGKYFKAQGPIYIFVGGEWSISPGLLSTGLTHDMAVENAGMLFYTEHRYYGQSWPLGAVANHNSKVFINEFINLENVKLLKRNQQ